MNLDKVFLRLTVRSWLALLVFLSAAAVVYGYIQRLSGGGSVLAHLGLVLAVVGILVGAAPPREST